MNARKLLSVSAALAMAVTFTLLPSFAQGTGGGGATTPPGGGGRGGGGGGMTTPGRTTSPTGPTQPTQQFPEFRRPIYFQGRVTYDDGTPADNVTVERVCNGIARPEAYTNSKGNFSFQLGRSGNVISDASVDTTSDPLGRNTSGRMDPSMQNNPQFSERDLIGCEIRASSPGYRSDSVNLAGRRILDNPDIGTIVLHRMEGVKGFTVSMADASAPKDAKKAFEKALKDKKNNKPENAMKNLEKAVALHPNYASAWYEMGLLYMNQKQNDKATECFNKSLGADDHFVAPLVPLAIISYSQNNWQETVDRTSRAISLNPYLELAYFYESMANVRLQKFDSAEKDAETLVKLDTGHKLPKIYHILGVAQANRGEFKEALKNMNLYLQYAPDTPDAAIVKDQIQRLEGEVAKTQATQTSPQQQ